MRENICGACGNESWRCGCPTDGARDAKAKAARDSAAKAHSQTAMSVTEELAAEFARGVAEERARWEEKIAAEIKMWSPVSTSVHEAIDNILIAMGSLR